MNNKTFNLQRLGYFIRRQATLNIQPVLIGIGGIFGLLLFISLWMAWADPQDYENFYSLLMVVFFIGGFIFTSRIFSELNSPGKSYGFLTLPVSNLEKIVGSWLLSSPIYVLGFMLFSFFILLITQLILGVNALQPDVFGKSYFKLIALFTVLQPIFFLGACTFKNYNLLKTLLSVFLTGAFLVSFTALLVWIIFGGDMRGHEFSPAHEDIGRILFKQIIPVIFWFIVGPMLLLISYFKLKEREV